MGKNKAVFTMRIGSLIDANPLDYVGIYDKDGYLIGHERNGQNSIIEQQAEELIQEVKNENQLQLNF